MKTAINVMILALGFSAALLMVARACLAFAQARRLRERNPFR